MKRTVLTDAQWAKMEPLCLGTVTDRGRSGKDDRLFIEAVLWIARMRFELMPGQNYDPVDAPPLIQDVAFGGLTADKAFDIHASWTNSTGAGRQPSSPAQEPHRQTRGRPRRLSPTPPDREFLRQAEGVQAHRHAKRNDRSIVLRYDPPRRRRHEFTRRTLPSRPQKRSASLLQPPSCHHFPPSTIPRQASCCLDFIFSPITSSNVKSPSSISRMVASPSSP